MSKKIIISKIESDAESSVAKICLTGQLIDTVKALLGEGIVVEIGKKYKEPLSMGNYDIDIKFHNEFKR